MPIVCCGSLLSPYIPGDRLFRKLLDKMKYYKITLLPCPDCDEVTPHC